MKTFIWINGREVKIIERETIKDAIQTAENFSDHSEEIIVREIDWVDDFRTKKETFGVSGLKQNLEALNEDFRIIKGS